MTARAILRRTRGLWRAHRWSLLLAGIAGAGVLSVFAGILTAAGALLFWPVWTAENPGVAAGLALAGYIVAGGFAWCVLLGGMVRGYLSVTLTLVRGEPARPSALLRMLWPGLRGCWQGFALIVVMLVLSGLLLSPAAALFWLGTKTDGVPRMLLMALGAVLGMVLCLKPVLGLAFAPLLQAEDPALPRLKQLERAFMLARRTSPMFTRVMGAFLLKMLLILLPLSAFLTLCLLLSVWGLPLMMAGCGTAALCILYLLLRLPIALTLLMDAHTPPSQ